MIAYKTDCFIEKQRTVACCLDDCEWTSQKISPGIPEEGFYGAISSDGRLEDVATDQWNETVNRRGPPTSTGMPRFFGRVLASS
jgi:hypothetical protein